MGINDTLGAHDIIVHSYGHEKYISLHVEIDAKKTAAEAHDISEEVEAVLQKKMGVDPVVHIDPVYPDNPMVQKVKKELDLISSNDDRIINTHDIRIVNTDNHNLSLIHI